MTGNRHGKYRTFSVHKLRRRARSERARIETLLATADRIGNHGTNTSRRDADRITYLVRVGLPAWTRGVHVAKAGPFQHQVIVTEWRDRS